MSKSDELEAEADRILRDAGNLREHGILPHPDKRQRKEVLINDEQQLDDLNNREWDRRSTSNRTTWE